MKKLILLLATFFSINAIAQDTILVSTQDQGSSETITNEYIEEIVNYIDETHLTTDNGASSLTTFETNGNQRKANHQSTNIKTSFSVFPNPGTGLYTIYAVNAFIKNIVVYSVIGDVVLEKNINNLPNTPLDISHLAKGVYNIKVISAKGEVTIEKLVYQ